MDTALHWFPLGEGGRSPLVTQQSLQQSVELPFVSLASVTHADKIVIPHVSAWLVSGLDEDLKYQSSANGAQKKKKKANVEITVRFTSLFLLSV